MLLPPSLGEMIEEDHPVRVVNEVIDQINIEPLLVNYQGGGTSVYHPRMMLKVLVYAYLTNIYSSRKIESALKENIHFMWLSAMSHPDHNTIARFRTQKLQGVIKQIFGQIVELLVKEGLLGLEEIYTDGTKMESKANKYSFVWGRAIKRNKERIAEQLEALWDYTQGLAEQELAEDKPDFERIDKEKVVKTIQKIDQALEGKPVTKKVKQKLAYAKKNWPEKCEEYEQKERVLAGRSSYSKTDPDATFMRMKDDHMGNGQLKPAYNWQISTSNQYIVNTSIHNTTTDQQTLKPHLKLFTQLYNQSPKELCADAGYGSEENYLFIENQNIKSYVKYYYFHKEQSSKWKEDPFRSSNLHYNPTEDVIICPMGQKMRNIGTKNLQRANGFIQKVSNYQSVNCKGCPMRSSCFKGKGNRVIQRNHQLERLKEKSKSNLLSNKGLYHRSKRPVEPESVFGNIKHNKGFKRFLLSGSKKVEIETTLLAIAHNLAKKAA